MLSRQNTPSLITRNKGNTGLGERKARHQCGGPGFPGPYPSQGIHMDRSENSGAIACFSRTEAENLKERREDASSTGYLKLSKHKTKGSFEVLP